MSPTITVHHNATAPTAWIAEASDYGMSASWSRVFATLADAMAWAAVQRASAVNINSVSI